MTTQYEELERLGTATLSDALDRLGIDGCALGVAPVHRGRPAAGPARTVRYGACGQDKGTVGDFIDDIHPGEVVVIDNDARLDATVWGDIMTEFAHSHGIAATVIDGVCRDTDVAGKLGYPVFSRGRYMRTGKDRVQVEELDGPVTVAGIRVTRGDAVLCDNDGVVIIPAARLEEVLAVAREIFDAEERIREAVRTGTSLSAARRANGYHALQTARA